MVVPIGDEKEAGPLALHVGIIGYPLKHTVSPAFQHAAFQHLGLDVHYDVWETEPHHLKEAVERLRSPQYLGANVTIPYKEAVIPFLEELDSNAEKLGAVNTVVNRGGRLYGHNTDVEGFLRALREDAEYVLEGKKALVLGAGGSARAVGFGLAWGGISYLALTNRTLPRAQALARELAPLVSRVEVFPWLQGLPGEYDLLVNCTPVGMRETPAEGRSPLEGLDPSPSALICDLVYNPEETPLLAQAKLAGCRTLGGLAMLVHQGAASFQLWTGRDAPRDVMLEAASRALR